LSPRGTNTTPSTPSIAMAEVKLVRCKTIKKLPFHRDGGAESLLCWPGEGRFPFVIFEGVLVGPKARGVCWWGRRASPNKINSSRARARSCSSQSISLPRSQKRNRCHAKRIGNTRERDELTPHPHRIASHRIAPHRIASHRKPFG